MLMCKCCETIDRVDHFYGEGFICRVCGYVAPIDFYTICPFRGCGCSYEEDCMKNEEESRECGYRKYFDFLTDNY